VTREERALAVAGGILGGLIAFTIGMPVALHIEKVLQDRARERNRRFETPSAERFARAAAGPVTAIPIVRNCWILGDKP
jgi:hypothetical protein